MTTTHANLSEQQAWKTIFVAEIDSSLIFSMVEYSDGQLDILRNGQSISSNPWPGTELINCVSAFQKVSRLAAAAHTQHQQ
jgi:hypothetical protein